MKITGSLNPQAMRTEQQSPAAAGIQSTAKGHMLETTIRIQAAPEAVWAVLMDFAVYPQWSAFVEAVEGDPVPGATLATRIKSPSFSAMKFRPRVLVANPNREFRWLGKLFVKGIFDGEHYFRLQAEEDGSTLFTHGELFSGLLSGLLLSTMQDLEAGFEAFNHALKARVEELDSESDTESAQEAPAELLPPAAQSNTIKNTLRSNAAFSFISGLLLFLNPAAASELITVSGDAAAALFTLIGAGLLLFGAAVALLSFRRLPQPFWVRQVTRADWGWVIACMVVALIWLIERGAGMPVSISPSGISLIAVSAAIVGVFALRQGKWLRGQALRP